MIAAANLMEAGDEIDFIALIRAVADVRKVSVHDILSPSPRTTFAHCPRFNKLMPRYYFDPDAGWSWREVLVWAHDASRAQDEQRDAQQTDDARRENRAWLDKHAR